jgi:hypothetical protein
MCRPLSFLLLVSLFVAAPAQAQWAPCGRDLTRETYHQVGARAVPNGAGGAIVVWQDSRDVADPLAYPDIYARAITAAGEPLGMIGGTPICTAPRGQQNPEIGEDGSGGAFLVWEDFRNSTGGTPEFDLYAHRVDSSGSPLWATDGYPVCTTLGAQGGPKVISDGSGGAIVAWHDFRSGPNSDIYVQRLSASGAPLWTVNGVPLCTAPGDQSFPRLASDGAGGAIVTWQDRRGAAFDIYARRVNSSGTPLWTADGVPVSATIGEQSLPHIVADGTGGAIIAWDDRRSGTARPYAARVDSSGVAPWTAHGILLSLSGAYPKIVSDQAGGAIVAWCRGAQRLDGTGFPLWTSGGVVLTSLACGELQMTEDGLGGAIVAWHLVGSGTGYDVYAQSVSASGAPGSSSDGVSVCAGSANQYYPTIARSGSGAAIVAWVDERDDASTGADIYAMYTAPAGTPTSVSVALVQAEAIDEGVRLRWHIPRSGDPLVGVVERKDEARDWTGLSDPIALNGPEFVYTDREVEGGRRYGYRMRLTQGLESWHSNEAWVEVPVGGAAPRSLTLARPFPSPSDGHATFRIGLPRDGAATLRIYDTAGRAVSRIVEGSQPAGWLVRSWNGRDDSGRPVASGVYFATLEAGGTVVRRKVVVTR